MIDNGGVRVVDLKTIRLSPGDVLLYRYVGADTLQSDVRRIRRSLAVAFPGHKVLMIPVEDTIEIIREETVPKLLRGAGSE